MTRSTVRNVEVQKLPTPTDPEGFDRATRYLHMVAILTEAADGWRCYEAAHMLALDTWEADKAAAVEWTRLYGNKVRPEHAARYFHGLNGLTFAA